ncbi:MAG: hypothetical protein IJY38_02215 [Clostridia bacterium]|nr:hypothetical protein [Clostridia bacterium]
MKKVLLGKIGNFYKANLHTHTLISDGEMTPEEAKAEYQKRGYKILAYTDHEVLVPHNDLTDENFLAITSYEVVVNEYVEGAPFPFAYTCHLNFLSKDKNKTVSPCFSEKNIWLEKSKAYISEEAKKVDYPIRYDVDVINDMIKKGNENGFLVTLNHPAWSMQTYKDYAPLKGLWGVEVYNGVCDYTGFSETETPYVDLLNLGNAVVPIAADDTHWKHAAYFGWSMIEAESLTYEKVFEAMEKGDIYSSNGPSIYEISIDGAKLFVRCSKASEVRLNTELRWTQVVHGEQMTQAEIDLTGYFNLKKQYPARVKPYIRITVEDEKGNRAWSRGYFLEEFFSE